MRAVYTVRATGIVLLRELGGRFLRGPGPRGQFSRLGLRLGPRGQFSCIQFPRELQARARATGTVLATRATGTVLMTSQAAPRALSRSFIALLVSAALLLAAGPAPALAAVEGDATHTKTEVVYASLTAEGTAETSYTVNRFDVTDAGTIVDFGSYASVKALNQDVELAQTASSVTFDAAEGTFYYQGNAENPSLPWTVSVEYTLDGEQVQAEQLAGASGELGISLRTQQNAEVNSTFLESFVMQVSFTLDSTLATDIEAEGASIAEAGSDVTVSFTVLPGEDADCSVSARVSDFEMDGIQIVALPYSSVIDMPETDELIGQFDELSEAITELSGGLDEISTGMQSTSGGLGELASGDGEFADALGTMSSSFSQLTSASSQIDSGLSEMNEQLSKLDTSDFDDLAELGKGLVQMADALETLAEAAGQVRTFGTVLSGAWTDVGGALSVAEAAAPSDEEVTELVAYLSQNAGSLDADQVASVESLVAEHEALAAVSAVYDAYSPSVTQATTVLTQLDIASSLTAVAAQLDTAADGLSSAASGLSQLTELVDGVDSLAAQYAKFDSALSKFGKGLEALDSSYDDIVSGSSQLDSAVSQLADAVAEVADGVATLDESTSGLSEEAESQIEDMLGDYEYPAYDGSSFASDENGSIGNVQFILTTAAIERPTEDLADGEEQELTFWQRVLALFG